MEEIVGTLILLALCALGIVVCACVISAQGNVRGAQYADALSYCPGAASCDGAQPRLVNGHYCRPLVVGHAVVAGAVMCDIPAY